MVPTHKWTAHSFNHQTSKQTLSLIFTPTPNHQVSTALPGSDAFCAFGFFRTLRGKGLPPTLNRGSMTGNSLSLSSSMRVYVVIMLQTQYYGSLINPRILQAVLPITPIRMVNQKYLRLGTNDGLIYGVRRGNWLILCFPSTNEIQFWGPTSENLNPRSLSLSLIALSLSFFSVLYQTRNSLL